MRLVALGLTLVPTGLAAQTLELVAPPGLTSPVPGHAQFRPAVAKLGRTLFFDKGLSVDRKTACASCHLPEQGFASKQKLPQGSLGKRALRHAPTLYNRAWGRNFGWVGKAKSLEEQVILPISDPNEMALPLDEALQRLGKNQQHAQQFRTLFGREPNKRDLSVALASYVRTLVHGDTVIDRFRAGEVRHLTNAEKAGLWIFESKGGCWKCHGGANFTDERFHNTGVGTKDGKPRPGRMAITKNPKDEGAFKTPTLRALTETAPYMHDGSMATLEDVVAFYRRGGNRNKRLDRRMKPLALTAKEGSNLVAFLRALSRRVGNPMDPRRK